MLFKTIVGGFNGAFWWYGSLSEDRENFKQIYQNYLVALKYCSQSFRTWWKKFDAKYVYHDAVAAEPCGPYGPVAHPLFKLWGPGPPSFVFVLLITTDHWLFPGLAHPLQNRSAAAAMMVTGDGSVSRLWPQQSLFRGIWWYIFFITFHYQGRRNEWNGWCRRAHCWWNPQAKALHLLPENIRPSTYSERVSNLLADSCIVRSPVFGRNQNLAPQSIMAKPIEVYYLDKWFVITPYVAGLYPAFMLIVDQNSIKGSLKVIDCIVLSAECWYPNGNSAQRWLVIWLLEYVRVYSYISHSTGWPRKYGTAYFPQYVECNNWYQCMR